jgi:hypothetical protein
LVSITMTCCRCGLSGSPADTWCTSVLNATSPRGKWSTSVVLEGGGQRVDGRKLKSTQREGEGAGGAGPVRAGAQAGGRGAQGGAGA